MNKIKIIMAGIALTLQMPVAAWSDDAPPPSEAPFVELDANLNITTCFKGADRNLPCASLGVIGLGSSKITLYPTDDGDVTHLRGHLTLLSESMQYRVIGILTIDKWTYVLGNDQKSFNYNLTIEILDRDGDAGKMTVFLNNQEPSQISLATLVGRNQNIGEYRFSPQFSIGPAYQICSSPNTPSDNSQPMPQPNPPGSTPVNPPGTSPGAPLPTDPTLPVCPPKFSTHWKVIKGQLL